MTNTTLTTLPGYHLGENLYQGTRTLVYRGTRTADNQPVVIKFLRNEYPSFSELVQFRNQYTIAKNLNLPGIVKPLALETYRNGYALVMPDDGYISVGKWRQGKWAISDFLPLAIQLADILHGLTQNRVIHKDIKPANILIHPDTRKVKLIDFSISSLLPKETQEIQNPNVLEGTMSYISPEQTGRMNRGIDYRTDFYSLGVTFYELLAGKLPFQSDDLMELVHSHIAKLPAPICEKIPQILANIVMKLMAKNAESRYQSALGLKHDLEICLRQWQQTGNITEFAIAQNDRCDRFLIPEKLYGRESEVAQLLQAFDRVVEGNTELMLVAGFSGIGKTAVVNEVHKPIVRQRGYFIKGKFDQFNRNIPFSAFVQAFRNLIGQLLGESDAQLAIWKTKILEAVGENGRVIIDVIPELESLVGKQPEVPELSGSAAQNRFNLLFQKFVQVFAQKSHPLTIFLDDLQWADLASLELLKLLMNEAGNLLILGAYRDNEVSPTHPFMLAVNEIVKSGAIANTITLRPLSVEDTNRLIADTLTCQDEIARPLTEIVDRKTKGNPFFTTQFLKALHQDGAIEFDRDRGYWQCDLTRVRGLAVTDDVVEFMAAQLQKLPDSTQTMLKLAACIGAQFDLSTLAIVSEQSQIDASAALWKALTEGLILPQNDVYKFYQDADYIEHLEQPTVDYKFLHYRVQQAAYSLIPEDQKQATHLKMGQLLLQKSSTSEREERLFEIVNHLNVGIALITSPPEREYLSELNLAAGQKAKAATAYGSAVSYLSTGIDLLPKTAWERHYSLTLALHEEIAEASYLNTDFEQMEQWANVVLQQAQTLLDTIKVQQIRILGAKAQGQLLESIQIGLTVLKTLGIEFPGQPTQSDIGQAFGLTRALWADTAPKSLLALPPMADPLLLAAMEILTVLVSAAYMAFPNLMPLLVFKQVELSIQSGNSPISIVAYSEYGLILANVIGDRVNGYEFGELALSLLEKLQAKSLKCRSWYVVHTYTKHWKIHLSDMLSPLQEAYHSGLETGDIEMLCLNAYVYCSYAYHSGQNLAELAKTMEAYRQTIANYKQTFCLRFQEIYQQTVLNLIGKSDSSDKLTGEIFDQRKAIPELKNTNQRTALFFWYINQTILAYIFEKSHEAVQFSAETAQYLDGGVGLFGTALYPFYDALIQLTQLADATQKDRQAILLRMQNHQDQLQGWATLAPMNHQHRWELVEAERCRVLGHKTDSMEAYDRAISGAKENGYIQEEALANELAAKFYLNWGKEKVAAGYMQEAYYCYARWGAKAKTDDLEQRYPDLLRPILQPNLQTLNPLETLASITTTNFDIYTSAKNSRSSSSIINNALDFAAIIKASQALSGIIQLDELLHQLTQIILQNSGGDRCALILPDIHGEWQVRAIATPEETKLYSEPLQDNPNIPVKLIQYVKNTQEIVAIDNIKTELPVIDNYLTERQPKSILCLPILNQGHLIGILYLKNRSTSGVFTSDRVLILNFLCTQAAISLENARLYQTVQDSELKFRAFVEDANDLIYSITAEGTFSYLSPQFEEMWGYKVSDFLNQSFVPLIHPEDLPKVVAANEKIFITGHKQSGLEFRTQHRDGYWFWITCNNSPIKDDRGLVIGLRGIARDISDRKQAEAALQQKEAEYRGIFEAVIDGLTIADLETGLLIAVNPAYFQMFGYSEEEILRIHPIEMVHADSHSKFIDFLTAVRSGQEFTCEAACMRKDGSIMDIEVRAIPFWYDGKKCGLSILRDVSKRKQMELVIKQKNHSLEQTLIELQQAQLQIIQNEKMSALGGLVAGVAHEMNNPLSFISATLQQSQPTVAELIEHLKLYQETFPQPGEAIIENAEEIDLEYSLEDLPKALNSMVMACDRLKNISTSLRTFSRADKDYKVPFNIHEGIDSTILILKHRLKANENRPAIEVVTNYGNLPEIECFPGQLNQVFMNILANAIDAVDESNQGRSFAEIKDNPNQITIQTSMVDSQVKITIADNGMGMSEEIKQKIFDHLFTTKAVGKGTGLGLAIARQIVVEKHGGSLEVNSTLGRGTEFIILLPMNK